MILIGLYENKNIDSLELNHRKFCDVNNFQYEKFYIKNYEQKWRMVLHYLEKYDDKLILFIDSMSYFKYFKFNFEVDKILMQEENGVASPNFFAVKSCHETREVFRRVFLYSAQNLHLDFKTNYDPVIDINLLKKYLYQENSIYFNVSIQKHIEFWNVQNILVCDTKFHKDRKVPLSKLLCEHTPGNFEEKKKDFDIINPGMKNAIVSLYTENIKGYGIVSELNISEYCLKNNLTYYIYRKIPDIFQGVSGNWLKPHLLRKHIEEHENICWIDSDILIFNLYKIPFQDEISVYNDPSTWEFNSGFMQFRNTEKNINLLEEIISITESIENRSTIDAHGGDQRYFIESVKKYYPTVIPKSNYETNSFLEYHIDKPVSEINAMVHFMGIPDHIRQLVMDYFYQRIELKQTLDEGSISFEKL
jgi:hypothetical protein